MKNKSNIGIYLTLMLSSSFLISCSEDQNEPLVLDPCECYEILSQGLESNALYDTCNQALHADDKFINSYTKCQYAAITGSDTATIVIPQNKTPEIQIPDNGAYSLIIEECEVRFLGRNSILNKKEKAKFKFSEGSIIIQDSTILETTLVVDISSLEITSQKDNESTKKLTSHLLSKDFLWAEKYPTATFTLTGSNHGTFKLKVEGSLTIRGVTKKIIFHTSLIGGIDDTVTIGGSFVINRTDFGVNYNSGSIFSSLGDQIIDDIVPIAFNIKAKRIKD